MDELDKLEEFLKRILQESIAMQIDEFDRGYIYEIKDALNEVQMFRDGIK